jgi:SAM-dependent methyltransferase
MHDFFRRNYRNLKNRYLQERGYVVPETYQSSFVHWGGGADAQYIFAQFLKDLPPKARILIVGVMGGRDYFLLKNLGYSTTALDIGPQPDIEPITFCNIEEQLPFADDTFDAVMIGEVLEHLREDVRALENIRRVLKPSGRLIVTVPFYNDWEDGHMRVHSPESGKRLLAMAGFTVVDYLDRPGLVWFNSINVVQHGISLLTYWLTGKTAYSWLTKLVGKLEWKLGHSLYLRPIRRFTRNFGGYYLCQKSDQFDHIAINKKLYTSAVQ